MKKVAIVGVEGSGKTVMLAGLGELYSHPDERGYFLAPKNFATASYVTDKIQRMRLGEWPVATAGDEMQGLDWTLKRKIKGQKPADVCEVSFLDFAGEVYRVAFGIRGGDEDAEFAGEAEALKRYIRDADEVIVLINLRDVITKGRGDPRVAESMWITNEILAFALGQAKNQKPKRVAIVISQSDSYKGIIEECGGAVGVLRKYLPHVANNYDWLDIFTVSAVDKSKLDDSGNIVPAPDFHPIGLKPIMDWVCGKTQERPGEPERFCGFGSWFGARVKIGVQRRKDLDGNEPKVPECRQEDNPKVPKKKLGVFRVILAILGAVIVAGCMLGCGSAAGDPLLVTAILGLAVVEFVFRKYGFARFFKLLMIVGVLGVLLMVCLVAVGVYSAITGDL